MKFIAEHNGVTARIRQDSPDIGWYLYITLPNGDSKDHLQDTKEIAISQAADDYGIPPAYWKVSQEIYISLRNEGTDVWRPVEAIPLGNRVFKVPSDTKIPESEEWEFLPGSILECTEKQISVGPCMVATLQKKTEQDAAANP